jgi:hypothetical protein
MIGEDRRMISSRVMNFGAGKVATTNFPNIINDATIPFVNPLAKALPRLDIESHNQHDFPYVAMQYKQISQFFIERIF